MEDPGSAPPKAACPGMTAFEADVLSIGRRGIPHDRPRRSECRRAAGGLCGAPALSPVDVTEAVIARIAAREPKLDALYAYDPDSAHVHAKASEGRWLPARRCRSMACPARSRKISATTRRGRAAGDRGKRSAAAPRMPPPAARLLEAGCVILAKTTMPDYGMLSSGLSSFHQLTRNPWDLSKNPGGSSAGAGRLALPATDRCMSVPISAVRSACRRAGVGLSASNRASGGCRSIRAITVGPPGR